MRPGAERHVLVDRPIRRQAVGVMKHPLVARGGCVVETETSRIDATVESRIAAIASKMFGGERESDRAPA